MSESKVDNYLDDSDFLSSEDDTYFMDNSSDERKNNELINSIINKEYDAFLKLIKNKNNLDEEIFDDIVESKINPLQLSLKDYSNCNDIKYISKLIELKYYNLNDAILYSVFNFDCYNYLKNFLDNKIFNYNNSNNDNIIIWGTRYSNLKIVYDVFDNISDIYQSNNQGLNCFLSTSLNSSSKDIFEIINFLIDKEINLINTSDNNDDNFLILLENNIHIKNNNDNKSIIVKFLYDNGLNINHQNKQGKNILMSSIENSNSNNWINLYDYVFFYVKNGINLDSLDNNGDSIIEYCINHIKNNLKLVDKTKIKIYKNNFKYFKNILNLIIENKEELTNNNKINLREFKLFLKQKKLV